TPGPSGPGYGAAREEPPVIVLAAADPANAYGAALPWPTRPDETPGGHRPGRKAGALVVLSGGELVLYVERGGKTLLSWTSDPAVLAPAAAGLAEAGRGGGLGRPTRGRGGGAGGGGAPAAEALAGGGVPPHPPRPAPARLAERGQETSATGLLGSRVPASRLAAWGLPSGRG